MSAWTRDQAAPAISSGTFHRLRAFCPRDVLASEPRCSREPDAQRVARGHRRSHLQRSGLDLPVEPRCIQTGPRSPRITGQPLCPATALPGVRMGHDPVQENRADDGLTITREASGETAGYRLGPILCRVGAAHQS